MPSTLPEPDHTGMITTRLHRLREAAERLYAIEPLGSMQSKDSPAHWELPIKAYRALPVLLEAVDRAYAYRRALAAVGAAIQAGDGARGLVEAEAAGKRCDAALAAVASLLRADPMPDDLPAA